MAFERLAGHIYHTQQQIVMFTEALSDEYYPAVTHIHDHLQQWAKDDDNVPDMLRMPDLPTTINSYMQEFQQSGQSSHPFVCFMQGAKMKLKGHPSPSP